MTSQGSVPALGPLKRQFIRIMRWAALFAMAIAASAVFLVARGDTEPRVHMLIATALGVGLTVLIGIALMTLFLLSSRVGQDADAAGHNQKGDDDN